MFYLKKLLSAALLPPFGLILLAALGLLLMRRYRRLGATLAATAVLLMGLASIPLIANALLRGIEYPEPLVPERLKDADAIVVLAGGSYHSAREYGGDTVNALSLERVRYAARLARQSGLPLLVTGGAPFGGRPESESMREVLQDELGIKVRWVETASRDTAENASLSAPILRAAGIHRIVLVSHAWHLPRAIPLFTREGFAVVPAPTGFATDYPSLLKNLLPSARSLARSEFAAHEWLGKLMQSDGGN
jgi:uncharacterized SAM-binding protein YcdF (DUF218 family)